VAILPAQLRGRIPGAQYAGLFDSLFEREYLWCEWSPRPEIRSVLIAHRCPRAERTPVTSEFSFFLILRCSIWFPSLTLGSRSLNVLV
jgi:hypothetical protein